MRVIEDQRSYAMPRVSPPPGVDASTLEKDLRAKIRGDVEFDEGARAAYSTDASNYRQIPIGVVFPQDADDAVAALEVCRKHGAPIVARGAGTSLAGQAVNVAVVFDFSRYMDRILSIDPKTRTATVQPGAVLDDLQAAARPHGLLFGPDPSTHNRCTIGGMIGNNSCGPHSQMSGRTSDNIIELDVVTYDGRRFRFGASSKRDVADLMRGTDDRSRVYQALSELAERNAKEIRTRFPKIPRRVSGYNLDELLPENGFNVARALVGTEGTCVLVLEAKVRLLPAPAARTLLVLGYDDIADAGDAVPEANKERSLIALEAIDQLIVDGLLTRGGRPGLDLLPDGQGWLLLEFGAATPAKASANARFFLTKVLRSKVRPTHRLLEDPVLQRQVWSVRESALAATAFRPDTGKRAWEGWEDAAVPPRRLGDYLRSLRALCKKYGFQTALYGHFGQGCVHTRIDFDLHTGPGVDAFRRFLSDAADLVVSFGGSLSGEHGDGQSRAEFLPRMFGQQLVAAFGEFKRIWDPEGRMNPGKVVNPFPAHSNLRIGPEYRPRKVATKFAFPRDGGDFGDAMVRCVGVGLCRRTDAGTMCPSYRVTKDERHSTRGRARLLFEMLQGDVVDGWRSKEVKDALDLCLSCKACRSECPVQVDMATYKAEFLSHYHQWRLRPRSAHTMGRVARWARWGAVAPNVSNWLGRRSLSKWVAGIHPARRVPEIARQTFRKWFAKRPRTATSGRRVLLWPDTFTNFFDPDIGQAAVRSLEALGFEVVLPSRGLCCGRPLYDYGWVGKAKNEMRRNLKALREEIRKGTPMVGLEPSCTAAFRDELGNLFPKDADAKRLASQTFTFAEFLDRNKVALPTTARDLLVQRHCHQASVMGFAADERVLAALGGSTEILDAGCCGMAGSFGFERQHYDVSVQCAERVLAPRIRAAPQGTTMVADGFSCRTQIEQLTGKKSKHLAQLVDEALGKEKA